MAISSVPLLFVRQKRRQWTRKSPTSPENGLLKVGKSLRHGVLKRGNKISSKNKHEHNRPKLVLQATFARLNCRLFPVDLAHELLLLDFYLGDFLGYFRIDVRLHQAAKRSNDFTNHVVISHYYAERGLQKY